MAFRVIRGVNGAQQPVVTFVPTEETFRLFGIPLRSGAGVRILLRAAERLWANHAAEVIAQGTPHSDELIAIKSLFREFPRRAGDSSEQEGAIARELLSAYCLFHYALTVLDDVPLEERAFPAGISDQERQRLENMGLLMQVHMRELVASIAQLTNVYDTGGDLVGTSLLGKEHDHASGWHKVTIVVPWVVVKGVIYVLWGRRGAQEYAGFWSFLGGHNQLMESDETGAKELREEAQLSQAGFDVSSDQLRELGEEPQAIYMASAFALSETQMQGAMGLAQEIQDEEDGRDEQIIYTVHTDPGLRGLIQFYVILSGAEGLETRLADARERLGRYEARLAQLGIPVTYRMTDQEQQAFFAVPLTFEQTAALGFHEGATAAEAGRDTVGEDEEVTQLQWVPLDYIVGLRGQKNKLTDVMELFVNQPEWIERLRQFAQQVDASGPRETPAVRSGAIGDEVGPGRSVEEEVTGEVQSRRKASTDQ
jgi:8-oxo-dGTP pyrophosphatase MutT (NUDIX family)